MIRQLVDGIVARGIAAAPRLPEVPAGSLGAASDAVLLADPLDLILYGEQCWERFCPSAGRARAILWTAGRFDGVDAVTPISATVPGWDHLACSFVLENTRAVQILRRVVQQYRLGESLGIPSDGTRRWLDAAEVLLLGADARAPSWLGSSAVRPDAEAGRRNAYWRLLGMDLAFGNEDNRPAQFHKANAANTNFGGLFEAFLTDLPSVVAHAGQPAAASDADRERLRQSALELQAPLALRRRGQMLDRTELAAATVLGWVELTLASNTSVVTDLEAQAETPADRLTLIGARVGLPAHSRSAALFALSESLSDLLRGLESADIRPEAMARFLVSDRIKEAAARVGSNWPLATSSG